MIDRRYLKQGVNSINIFFDVQDQSLNRRDRLLYTLLVPDRARTLFPCFDQPNLKATYTLELAIPKEWCAVANYRIENEEVVEDYKKILFSPTEPLSTYLFSFVCGEFEHCERTRGDRTIGLYHCESDPKRIAQCDDILQEVFYSLEWLERYTAIDYPFGKYDLIIIPGFQYGGMEHTGATLYSDRRMFLSQNPSDNERLSRSRLIAHETAHMWFGDYVTMEWFSDVWTTEVFSNSFSTFLPDPMSGGEWPHSALTSI